MEEREDPLGWRRRLLRGRGEARWSRRSGCGSRSFSRSLDKKKFKSEVQSLNYRISLYSYKPACKFYIH